MRLALQSTEQVFDFEKDGQVMQCRLWTGHTRDGVPVHAYIASVSPQTHDAEKLRQFEAELREITSAIDIRFVP